MYCLLLYHFLHGCCFQELNQNGHSPCHLRGEIGPAGHVPDTETETEHVDTDTCDQLQSYTHPSLSLLKMTNARANGLTKWLSKTNVIGIEK